MQNILHNKTKQFFFVLIKLSIVVSAFYFIYYKLTYNEALSISNLIFLLKNNQVLTPKNILLLAALTGLNWFFEIIKWQTLVSPFKKLAFKNALKQCLGALTASLFTPNRIGEYGAKAMYYPPYTRKRIMLFNLIGNTTQMGVTTVFGLIGFNFYIIKYQPEINYYKFAEIIVLIVTLLIIIFLILKKSNFNTKGFHLKKTLNHFIAYPKSKLIQCLLLALIRYTIFSFQFYVLLIIFKVNLNYLEAMVIITTIYLLASIIPSIFIFDAAIKGSIAVYLFALAGVNTLIILAIITIMWICNFVIPSLFGSYFVLTFKHEKHEDHL